MKRTIIFAGVLALLLTPAILTAQQTSDSATLNLTGNVPSLVRIGFGNTATQDETFDFGNLSDAQQSDSVTVTYLGNVSFSIEVESTNGGVLVNQDQSGTNLQEEIAYTFSWGGSDITIDTAGQDVNLVSGVSSGINSTTAEVIVDQASLDNVDQDTTEGDIPAAGDYTDDLTFTITADE